MDGDRSEFGKMTAEQEFLNEHKEFWDKKILGWERDRYEGNTGNSTWLEALANRSSNSLRYRFDLTKK